MSTYNKLSRHELIKEIRIEIFRAIHGELTALVKDIRNSDSTCEAEKQIIGVNDSSNSSKSVKLESGHLSDKYKKKTQTKKTHRNLSNLKKLSGHHIKNNTKYIKEECQDSDASNDSSIVLSNLKTLVSSKKSDCKSSGVRRAKLKTKSKSRFVKTHPDYLENVDSVVQDDLYEAIVTSQFKKRQLKTYKYEVERFCDNCDYTTKSKRLMHKHKNEHKYESYNSGPSVNDNLVINTLETMPHDKIKIPLFCEACNFSTHKRKLMKSHKKLHKNVCIKREYDSNEFNMESIPLSQLNQKHAIEENYICNSDLKIQTSRIPYSCGQCDYQCDSISELSSHKVIHSAYTEFACGQCDFTCISRNGLINHKESHAE